MDEQIKNLQNNFDKQISILAKDISGLRERVLRIDDILRSGKEIERLHNSVSNAIALTEKKFSSLSDEMKKIDVRRIDLAKIESRQSAFRNEMEKFADLPKEIEELKENLIRFRKNTLTRYNFSRLERWMKEIEKELLELISIRAELSRLSEESGARFAETEKRLGKHDKIINKLRRKDYRDVRNAENRLMRHIEILSHDIKNNQACINLLNLKIKRDSKAWGKNRFSKKRANLKINSTKKKSIFAKIKDWFLEDSK